MRSNRINSAWRDVLSSENQYLLSQLFRWNLVQILETAEKTSILTLTDRDREIILSIDLELPNVCRLFFGAKYGDPGKTIREICRLFNDRNLRQNTNVPVQDLVLMSNTGQDLITLADVLLHFRNVNAHRIYPINDPGHALLLAGAIQRLIETSNIDERFQSEVDRLSELNAILITHCARVLIDNEKGELLLKGGAQRKTTDSHDVDETGKPKSENEKYAVSEEISPTFLKNAIRQIEVNISNQIAELKGLLPDRTELERTVHDATKFAMQQVWKKAEVHAIAPDQSKRTSLDRETAKYERVGEDPGAYDATREQDEHIDKIIAPPAITKAQAHYLLIQLRNEIWEKAEARGEQIEHWENILQAWIVKRMIRKRITKIKCWVKDKAISTTYEKHKDKMDPQLKEYASEMFSVVKRLTGVEGELEGQLTAKLAKMSEK